MGFATNCDNKGCGAYMEPLLDKEQDQVICSKCGKELKNITTFAKQQLGFLGQVVKNITSKQAFAVVCKFCNNQQKPTIKNDKAYCKKCGKELNLPSPVIYAIKNSSGK
jgi:DNA-directed RNA polymerase subunit M/transcription elongation factor TFIIS